VHEQRDAVGILIVDDDEAHRSTLQRHIASLGHRVTAAGSAEEALNRFSAASPDIILTDVKMPGIDGFGLLRRIKASSPATDVIMLTGYASMQAAIDAIRDGAFDFLLKPLDLDHVEEVMGRCIAERADRNAVLRPGDSGLPASPDDEIVGRHPKTMEIYKTIGALSNGTPPVLLTGETGTGKELVARCIHENSPCRDERFVAVNCAALTETLLESELFGHVKGAFTGATSDRKGLFELAGSGTILLDEIGDTSATLQAKLLRVLQEGEFYPVGSERVHRTRARVIASTNRDLARLVAAGEFREDLFFRLRVVEIHLPPLRERRSDIPLLVGHFLWKAGRKLGRAPIGITREALAALIAYVIGRATCASWRTPSRARPCSAEAPPIGWATSPSRAMWPSRHPRPPTGRCPPSSDRHVQRVLADTGGNKSEAARILGISRPRLDRMAARWDLTVN
jgi:DNA-binding NtrC family response regulator